MAGENPRRRRKPLKRKAPLSMRATPTKRQRSSRTATKTGASGDAAASTAAPPSSPPLAWADDIRSNIPYVERLSDGRWILASWVEATATWCDVTLDDRTLRTAATLEALVEAGAPTYATLHEAKTAALRLVV